ncbi:hypothetical protein [Rhizobium sp. BK176]|uniref:hypothetical protein n=1 Tax=Rhizobium sp. BK176 TaxID=2587071 RepID=UPI0021687F64|nr:hypothetical protein [Rhizobium sp. BK176]MCS4089128.1 hypothetical protein [Rhizobium sp. BK176]
MPVASIRFISSDLRKDAADLVAQRITPSATSICAAVGGPIIKAGEGTITFEEATFTKGDGTSYVVEAQLNDKSLIDPRNPDIVLYYQALSRFEALIENAGLFGKATVTAVSIDGSSIPTPAIEAGYRFIRDRSASTEQIDPSDLLLKTVFMKNGTAIVETKPSDTDVVDGTRSKSFYDVGAIDAEGDFHSLRSGLSRNEAQAFAERVISGEQVEFKPSSDEKPVVDLVGVVATRRERPTTASLWTYRSDQVSTFEGDAYRVPILFAMRGYSQQQKRVEWVERAAISIPSVNSEPVYTVNLPTAKETAFYRIGKRHYVPMVAHPLSGFIRTRIHQSDELKQFVAMLSWRDKSEDRFNLHPINVLSHWGGYVPHAEVKNLSGGDDQKGVFADVSFDGTFGGTSRGDLYANFEEACRAVGEISLRTERDAVLAAVSEIGRLFAMTRDRALAVVNEPKIIVQQDYATKTATVTAKVSPQEYPFAAVWFPLTRQADAEIFANELAAVRHTSFKLPRFTFTVHDDTEVYDFVRENILRLLDNVFGYSPEMRELRDSLNRLSTEDLGTRVIEMFSDATLDDAIDRRRASERSAPDRRQLEIAVDELRLFVSMHVHTPENTYTAQIKP